MVWESQKIHGQFPNKMDESPHKSDWLLCKTLWPSSPETIARSDKNLFEKLKSEDKKTLCQNRSTHNLFIIIFNGVKQACKWIPTCVGKFNYTISLDVSNFELINMFRKIFKYTKNHFKST